MIHDRTSLRAAIVGVAIGLVTVGSITGCGAGRKTKDSAIEGGAVGRYMDEQAEELSKIEGAKTARVGDGIKVTWESALLFDFDSAMLALESKENIQQMARVLVHYPFTEILIAGHTDAEGAVDHNQKLSERRAMSLYDFLVDLGVPPSRLTTEGYGGLIPVAPNDTEEGRRLNRRVEIEIRASEELKARASTAETRR